MSMPSTTKRRQRRGSSSGGLAYSHSSRPRSRKDADESDNDNSEQWTVGAQRGYVRNNPGRTTQAGSCFLTGVDIETAPQRAPAAKPKRNGRKGKKKPAAEDSSWLE